MSATNVKALMIVWTEIKTEFLTAVTSAKALMTVWTGTKTEFPMTATTALMITIRKENTNLTVNLFSEWRNPAMMKNTMLEHIKRVSA